MDGHQTSYEMSIMLRKDHTKVCTPEKSRQDPVESGKTLQLVKQELGADNDKENLFTRHQASTTQEQRPGKFTLSLQRHHKGKPEWQKRLSEQLQEKEQRLAKRRRVIPTMTPEELQCINTVWSILEKQHPSSHTTTVKADPLHLLSDELGVSHSHIHSILHGDPDHVVSEPYKGEILQKLEQWVQHQSLTFHSATPRTPRTKRRSSHDKNLLRYAGHHDNPHDSGHDNHHVVTTSTPSRSIKPKSCSPRQRLSSTLHHSNDLRMIVAQKRRSSNSSMHSSMSSFSSMTTTSSSKRAARPSYEPPSVKRRKLRLSGRLSMVHMGSERSQDHPLSLSQRMELEKAAFCPIEVSRHKIMTEISKLQKPVKQDHHSDVHKHMELEHLELSLKVWDKIQKNSDEKVEVVVANMASTLDLSHRRLTRFLRGDKGNLLTKQEAIKISTKLRDWLNEHP